MFPNSSTAHQATLKAAVILAAAALTKAAEKYVRTVTASEPGFAHLIDTDTNIADVITFGLSDAGVRVAPRDPPQPEAVPYAPDEPAPSSRNGAIIPGLRPLTDSDFVIDRDAFLRDRNTTDAARLAAELGGSLQQTCGVDNCALCPPGKDPDATELEARNLKAVADLLGRLRSKCSELFPGQPYVVELYPAPAAG